VAGAWTHGSWRVGAGNGGEPLNYEKYHRARTTCSKTVNANAHLLINYGLQLEKDRLKLRPRIADYYTSSQDFATANAVGSTFQHALRHVACHNSNDGVQLAQVTPSSEGALSTPPCLPMYIMSESFPTASVLLSRGLISTFKTHALLGHTPRFRTIEIVRRVVGIIRCVTPTVGTRAHSHQYTSVPLCINQFLLD